MGASCTSAGRASAVQRWVSTVILTVLLVAAFGVATPARPAAAAPAKADQIGIAGNAFPWEPHWNTFQGLMDESHAGWARVELSWSYIHPGPNEWNWGLYDDLV